MVHAILKRLWLLAFLPAAAFGSGIYNPGTSGGGGGSGGYALQPATVTIQGNQGIDITTGTVQNETSLSTGIPSLGQINNISFPNLLRNPGFETWRAGTDGRITGGIGGCGPNIPTNYADGWTGNFSCSGNNTAGMVRVTSPVKYGTYAMELTAFSLTAGGNNTFYVSQSIPNYSEYAGSSVTLSGWMQITVNTSSVNEYMTIDDGVTVSSVSLVTADSTWHFVSVTKFISPSATKLLIRLGQPSQANNQFTVYFDGLSLVRGDIPTDFAPPNYAATMDLIQTDSNGGIIGTPTNDAPSAGDVGETISCSLLRSAAASLTSATTTDICQVALTPGDWNLFWGAGVRANPGATTYTTFVAGVVRTSSSTVSGDIQVVPNGNGEITISQQYSIAVSAGNDYSLGGIPTRMTIASSSTPGATTPVYLVINATFSGSNSTMYGSIVARRAR